MHTSPRINIRISFFAHHSPHSFDNCPPMAAHTVSCKLYANSNRVVLVRNFGICVAMMWIRNGDECGERKARTMDFENRGLVSEVSSRIQGTRFQISWRRWERESVLYIHALQIAKSAHGDPDRDTIPRTVAQEIRGKLRPHVRTSTQHILIFNVANSFESKSTESHYSSSSLLPANTQTNNSKYPIAKNRRKIHHVENEKPLL